MQTPKTYVAFLKISYNRTTQPSNDPKNKTNLIPSFDLSSLVGSLSKEQLNLLESYVSRDANYGKWKGCR